MRKNTFAFLRMFAVVAAVTFALMGALVTPASADTASGIAAPCQVQAPGSLAEQGSEDQECEDLILGALPDGCDIYAEGNTFQVVGTDCATIQQGECPGNLILSNGNIIQFQCGAGGIVPSPTATSVPPTATDVPPTATDVPPTATDVPPTATDVPPTSTGTVTATDVPPTATATSTDTDTETDTDTTTSTTTETDEEVDQLPTTGQGPDNGQTGAIVLLLGAISMLLAGAAFAWQRRSNA